MATEEEKALCADYRTAVFNLARRETDLLKRGIEVRVEHFRFERNTRGALVGPSLGKVLVSNVEFTESVSRSEVINIGEPRSCPCSFQGSTKYVRCTLENGHTGEHLLGWKDESGSPGDKKAGGSSVCRFVFPHGPPSFAPDYRFCTRAKGHAGSHVDESDGAAYPVDGG